MWSLFMSFSCCESSHLQEEFENNTVFIFTPVKVARAISSHKPQPDSVLTPDRCVSLIPAICGFGCLGDPSKTNTFEKKDTPQQVVTVTHSHSPSSVQSALKYRWRQDERILLRNPPLPFPPSFLFTRYLLSSHVSSRQFNAPHPEIPQDRPTSTVKPQQFVFFVSPHTLTSTHQVLRFPCFICCIV